MPFTITACKFVGTTSLGLLTVSLQHPSIQHTLTTHQGVSYSLAALSIPSLLAFPSAKPAQHVLTSLQQSAVLHLRSLAALSVVSFNLAYMLSPARSRHPYLLWTSLAAAVAVAADFIPGQPLLSQHKDHVNGETVEQAVKASQRVEQARTVLGFAGFAMALVGLWGDGA
jgi:autophagy-related protein 33